MADLIELMHAAFTEYMRGVAEPWLRSEQLAGMQAALAAHEAWLKASGMTVVPVEPDEAMIAAGARTGLEPFGQEVARRKSRLIYRAMLSACGVGKVGKESV